jgi:hypothetical protein
MIIGVLQVILKCSLHERFGEAECQLRPMRRSFEQSGSTVPVCWGADLFNKVEVEFRFVWARTVFWRGNEVEGSEWKRRRGEKGRQKEGKIA